MNDDEIDALIANLRVMLNENGFGWAREQAEASIDQTWHPRWLAHALLDAAESVTVDLAEAELVVLNGFGVEDVTFERDGDADPDGDTIVPEGRAEYSEGIDRLRGFQRREALLGLVGMRETFQTLRVEINGIL